MEHRPSPIREDIEHLARARWPVESGTSREPRAPGSRAEDADGGDQRGFADDERRRVGP